MILGGFASHGVGGSTDLPIPFMYAMVGASWALTVSFAVMALAWKRPRFQGSWEAPERPRRRPIQALGLVLTVWVMLALYAGPDRGNAGVQTIYILVWVGLVPLALLAGHVWRDLSPWRTVTGWVGNAPLLRYPSWLGYWPAAAGLLAFVWLELASPDPGSADAMRTWVAAYAGCMLVGGAVFGQVWFDRADPFDVYSALIARMSPVVPATRHTRNPLAGLATIPVAPGLVAVLAVLLGSTAFDSFSSSQLWQSSTVTTLTTSLVLIGFCSVAGVAFVAAATATGGVDAQTRRQLPGALAHSLVPIVIGYVAAHYLSYLLEKGQGAVIALLDPLGRGWQPLGELHIVYFLSEQPALLATLKVACVVAGHVVAVVAAHDRALSLLPRTHHLTGQLAMLVLMVAYTFGGLYLLFSV